MEPFERRAAALVLALVAGLAPGPVSADPALTFAATSLGGGLTRWDVAVDFQDGLSRSGFVRVTFEGPFEPQSALLEANWPDIQIVDEGSTQSTQYLLQGGTGGGSSVDVVPLAQLVLPNQQSFTYEAEISRNGQNFVLVPEPSSAPLAAWGLGVVATLAARRRGAARR